MTSVASELAGQGRAAFVPWIRRVPPRALPYLAHSGRFWSTPAQREPAGSWRTWLMMAGRGFGKTFAGAHWVHALAHAGDAATRIALVGGTREDVRAVMVEGESGLLATASDAERPTWFPTRGALCWPSGATAFVYSAESPEGLRGPQHSHAWCDEIGKWSNAEATWDNLEFGLRLGARPRMLATTTPRPTALLRRLTSAPATVVTGGRTTDNPMLPDAFVAAVTARYGGTRLGRQELDGELIDEVEGALWTRAMIEAARVGAVPGLRRVVIGVDPPASTGGDACGIVVAGLGRDGIGYVIEDASVAGRSPEGWAAAVAAAAGRHNADRVVAEANNGGNMVESVLRAADAGLPVKLVRAAHGKTTRAEPVMTLYARGQVKHARAFPELEDELCGMIAGGGYEGPGRSPDRADACVWALTELMLGKRAAGPRVRSL